MTEVICKDINWFLVFVKSFNGMATYMHENLYCPELIELDACLTGMGGGRFNDLVYTYQFQNNEIPSMFTIVHFEMWNVLLVLRLWGPMWQGKHIVLGCDNEAVVSVVNTGVTKDNGLAALGRIIWLETALRDIQLKLVHVRGKDNKCADLLSRWHLVDHNVEKLKSIIDYPVWCNVYSTMLHINLNI